MNNLLKTLTASRVKSSFPESDLKLLLSAVKETRKAANDPAKLADAFYDSLEGLLYDLRMVTMDNHDAEAFLKPVSKTEVPDYHEIISNPMDLQTMLKKVKQRHYKSKKEFHDDLNLIWDNCFTYNATLDHPLRLCASRLKKKAERLLNNITDYKERADPVIPGEAPTRGVARVNGVTLNGTGRHVGSPYRSPSPTKQATPLPGQTKKVQRDSSFLESPAFVRSQDGMNAFMELDHAVDDYLMHETDIDPADPAVQQLKDRLLHYAASTDDDKDTSLFGDGSMRTMDGDIGGKRKLNGYSEDRPRKRARVQNAAEKSVVELWWDAMRADDMLTSGVPGLAYPTSSSSTPPSSSPTRAINDPPRETQYLTQTPRRRRKKKKRDAVSAPNTLLFHMNNNVRTLRRVRTTHAKFTALTQALEEAGGAGVAVPFVNDIPDDVDDVLDERPWRPVGRGIDMGEGHATGCLQWMGGKVLEHAGFQGTSKMALDVLASVTAEYLQNVGRTIRFLCDKYGNQMTSEEIILHTLFESGITQVSDLERYVKDDIIRYGGRLTDLEKKLANAYREATTEEAWDDDALFRNDGDEEEEGEFVMGNFAESFGDDFFGLKELGIADEFGLSSLTVPKRLLKGKGRGAKEGPSIAKPTEPPPPFPPPPPFVPLDSTTIDDQIGLLKPFYQARVSEISASFPAPALVPAAIPPPPALPGPSTTFGVPPLPLIPSLPPMPVNLALTFNTAAPAPPPDLPTTIVIPDDAPSASHVKMGPLGTINKATPAASAAKKKSKAKPQVAPGPPPGGDGDALPPATPGPPPPPQLMMSSSMSGELVGGGGTGKKGKGGGTPGKKKAKVDAFPPVVMASA